MTSAMCKCISPPSIPLVKWPVCPLCAAYGQSVPQTPYLHPIKLTTYWECEHHGHWRYVQNGWKRFFDPVNGPWGT